MPRRGAGRFLIPAVFEVRGGGADQFGNPDVEWIMYATRRVDFVETPAPESFEGGVLQSHTRALVKCRKDPLMMDLPTDGRVFVQRRYWSIISIADGDPHNTDTRSVLTITVEQGAAT